MCQLAGLLVSISVTCRLLSFLLYECQNKRVEEIHSTENFNGVVSNETQSIKR